MYISVYIHILVHWALPAQFDKWPPIWDLTPATPLLPSPRAPRRRGPGFLMNRQSIDNQDS